MQYVGLQSIQIFINAILTASSNNTLMNSFRELRHLIQLYYY